MTGLRVYAFLAVWLTVCLAALAETIDCASNVTISDADDAEQLRSACTTIGGSLTFAGDLGEEINLDGIVEIEGDVKHQGCEESWDDCTVPASFSISSSTLTKVGGALDFYYFQGLEELSFPNLAYVQSSVSLKRLHQLKSLDITSLARLGYFVLEAANLTTLRHESLEGFTGDNKYGSVSFWAADIESVDSFFNKPIVANGSEDQSRVTISHEYLPKVKSVNFGWAKVSELWVSGNDINVTLGESKTESRDIGSIVLKGNITSLNFDDDVKNLTVGRLTVEGNQVIEELDLGDLSALSSLTIQGADSLESIKLPKDALSWDNFDLSITNCGSLNLTENSGDEQTWYWPEGNISSIYLRGVNVSDDFFGSFLGHYDDGNDTQKVLKQFSISPVEDQPMGFNCTPFDELRDRGVMPDDYECNEVKESSACRDVAFKLLQYGLALVAIASYII